MNDHKTKGRGGDRRPSVTCPRCLAKTFNAHDIEQRYCPKCKIFWRINPAKLHVIKVRANAFKAALLEHGEGIITTSEFNAIISALHDLEVLLNGLETADEET
jgi:ribosomal protein S27AE